jgi:hypothetical protein
MTRPPNRERGWEHVETRAIANLAPTAGVDPDDASEEPLPAAYGIGTLVLMVRDPTWAHAHWDMGAARIKTLSAPPLSVGGSFASSASRAKISLRTTNSGPNVAAMTAWVRKDFDLVTRVLDQFQARADWTEHEDFQRRLDKDCGAAPDISQLWDQAPIGVTDSGLFTGQGCQRFVRPRVQEQLDELRRSADWHG